MTTVAQTAPVTDTEVTAELDAVVLGAGVAGLYQLHQLREQGLRVRVYDSASEVGGTWYWNAYPGARFDSESHVYQYFFSEELYSEWSWTERFPGQPEIERWLGWIADRLDLRRDIQLATKVVSAHYDEQRDRWIVRTDRGDVIDTQFFVACAGPLSAPLTDLFEGSDDFAGQLVHTSRWPREGIDLSGKRVGVVGIGATGIQVIQTIADQVEHLTVFARTPQYVLPMKNPRYGPAEQAAYKARFAELRDTIPHTFTGFEHSFQDSWADLTPSRRHEVLEELYEDGSLKLYAGGFAEVFFDADANEAVSEFVREKMRARLKDPHLCDVLIPTDYGFGTHRVPLETNYLEVYHRENVELVSVRDNAIARIVPNGLQLADGTVHELDVIVLATGFDAGTGALTRIDIRGRGGRSLARDWGRDIRSTMGLAIHGYPNLLTTSVPLAPGAALCNAPTCLQQQTEWISDTVRYLREQGKSVIEPTAAGEDAWVDHHEETASATLLAKTDSWWSGANVPGKPRRFLAYTGGVGVYREKCQEEAKAGYPSFELR
jgi:cyclohexanone monooxygenase/acetone monooxygenase